MQAAEKLSRDLDIDGYITACSQMSLSINDWIGLHGDPFYRLFGLPDLVKRALKNSAAKVNEEIRKKREEELSKISSSALTVNRHSTISGANSSYMDKVFK